MYRMRSLHLSRHSPYWFSAVDKACHSFKKGVKTEEVIDARDVAITKPKEDEESVASVATDGPISRGQNLDVPVSPSERHCATPSSAATVDSFEVDTTADGIGAELVSGIIVSIGSRTVL
eukprot:g7244.t1